MADTSKLLELVARLERLERTISPQAIGRPNQAARELYITNTQQLTRRVVLNADGTGLEIEEI